MRRTNCFLAGLLGVMCLATTELSQAAVYEIQYSNEEFKKLNTFEAHSLAKADRIFVKKDFRRAAAEYESFILEFDASKAIAYALLRRGRCLHWDKKRFEALKEYQEVLDYFPNEVKYAAAALYYTGEAHLANGNSELAYNAWADMAKDPDYSKEYLAAKAIIRLADNLAAKGKLDRAVKYWTQVAIDFCAMEKARQDAYLAKHKVIPYYIRTEPNEPKLRELYQKARGFGSSPIVIPEDVSEDRTYWSNFALSSYSPPHYRRSVSRMCSSGYSYNSLQKELREKHFRYWASQLEGKFPDWEDFQLEIAHVKLAYENDLNQWMYRVDSEFKKGYKEGDYNRVMKWISIYSSHKNKVDEYFTKLDFSKMSHDQTYAMMRLAYEYVRNPKMGLNIFEKFRIDKLNDTQRNTLQGYFWGKDRNIVERICAAFDDKDWGQFQLLNYYKAYHIFDKALPLADKMQDIPRYANPAVLMKAQMLNELGRYAEAIESYKLYQPPSPSQSLYPIAACYKSMGQLNQAIAQLREVESFYKGYAPGAALMIADYYNSAGIKKKYVAALYAVMDKYPTSGQSSDAHNRLEKMGYKSGGGDLDAD